MTTYGISVFITEELYDYGWNNYGDGLIAQNRAVEYIKGAFSKIDHNVNISSPTDRPSPPSEKSSYDNTIYTFDPCETYEKGYDTCLEYFVDWCDCTSGTLSEINILVSSTSQKGGGRTCGCGTYGHAHTGQLICDLPSSYDDYGFTDQHSAMQTVLHELGHLLMSGIEDGDGDGKGSHDQGDTYYHYDGKTVSPMYVQGDYNNCNRSQYTIVGGKELKWSDCTVGDFR